MRRVREHSLLKILVIAALGSGFWAFLFFASYRSFVFLHGFFGDASELLGLFFAVLFFALLVMLIFSNAVIAYSSLYRSRETEHLFTLPLDAEDVFAYKFMESALFSSWAFLLLGLPPMVAYGLSVKASASYYPAIAAFFVGFVGLPASVGSALAMLFAHVLSPRTRRAMLKVVGMGVAVAVLMVAVAVILGRLNVPITYFWMGQLLERLRFSQHPLLPSYWMSEGLRRYAEGSASRGLFFLVLVVVNSVAGYAVCDALARATYARGWSRAQEGRAGVRRRSAFSSQFTFLQSPALLLLRKDWITFRRDPVQWVQGAILLGLLGLYFVNLRNLSYHVATAFWKNLISFLNLAASCLVLATLITRFVYPLLSLEGRRFWILGLAPIPRERILWGKFAFAAMLSTALVEILIVISNFMLRSPPLVLWLQVGTVAVVCFALSGLAVGMSALYPDFREDNPSKIVSGFGGTLTLILSLIYVVAVIFLEMMPIHYRWVRRAIPQRMFEVWMAAVVVGVVALSAGMCFIPMLLGTRAMRRMEF
mgnify:CR=1 FL=1